MRIVILMLLLIHGGLASAMVELGDEQVLEILATEQPRDRAIRDALAWIRSEQRPDGSLADGDNRTALTSLGLMAHLSAGIAVHDPQHGEWMARSLRFVLGMQEPSGYFGEADKSRMYGHGITTLMLAEALGMCGDVEMEEAVRSALVQAVAVTVNAARVDKESGHEGGWRYQPHEKKSDLSLSGWQLMSLHASQQVGITVPDDVILAACDYARKLTGKDGAVGYQYRGKDAPALRGLGMLCFSIAGRDADPIVDTIAERIQRDPLEWKGGWLFYRVYYDAVGMSRARPVAWESYKHVIEEVLVDHQRQDGSWPSPPGDNESKYGRVYMTSMAVLALAVERHVLPAYQR